MLKRLLSAIKNVLLLDYRLRQVESLLREFSESHVWAQFDDLHERIRRKDELDELHQDALDRLNRDLYQLIRKVNLLESILAEHIEWEREDEQISLKAQLRQQHQSLSILEEQAAKHGIDTPLHILNGIRDATEKIRDIRRKLDQP